MTPDPCFCCGRKLRKNKFLAHTEDGQNVYVGPECHELIRGIEVSKTGYQPVRGGPRIFIGWIGKP